MRMNRIAAPSEQRRSPSFLAQWLGIDTRALALFRVALAVILLVDLTIRSHDLVAMYTDAGFFSVADAREYFSRTGDEWRWSLHLLSGSVDFQALLFAAAAIFAGMMLVGYRTRVATIASWVLLVSLHNRSPLLLNGGDVLLRMLLFWCMFLPLGRTWSLDALRRARRRSAAGIPGAGAQEAGAMSPTVVSIATAALLIQICVMYTATGLYKLQEDSWRDGDAMIRSLSYEPYARPMADVVLTQPWLVQGLGVAVPWLEIVGPLLLLLPWVGRYARLPVVVALALMHVGIEMCMTVGLFSYVSLAGLIAFLPASVFDNRLIRRIARYLVPRVPEPPVEAEVAAESPAAAIAEAITVAAGANGSRRWEMAGTVFSILAEAVCLFFLVYVVAWNASSLAGKRTAAKWLMPERLRWIGNATAVRQKWNMFANPSGNNGWYVARATLRDVEADDIDLLRGGAPVDESKPDRPARLFPNHRWRKLYRNLVPTDNRSASKELVRQLLAEYLCRQWNQRHEPDQQVVRLELLYILPEVGADAEDRGQLTVRAAVVELRPAEESGNFADALRKIERDALRKDERGESPLP